MLICFFLSSAATGAVQGSLSTTRKIIQNIDPDLNGDVINIAKYSDLLIYIPANFLSVWLMENYGLRRCIGTGSFFMLSGSILRLMSVTRNLWFWYFGHIVCLASGAFLKNPVTKLATNWFGDKERGFATSIGQVSSPIGLLISQVMIMMMFENDDKHPSNRIRAEERWNNYIWLQALMSIAFVMPALLFIRNKPDSPPSFALREQQKIDAQKKSFKEVMKQLLANKNFLYLFLYFQLVNTVTVYGGEVNAYLDLASYTINEISIA